MGIKDERKFENLHKLIELLLDHPQGLTKAEIARKLDVHRSTAAEYLDSMEGINAPVYEISPGRYTIDRDRFEVKISVDMHEALALHLASRLLTTRTDKHNPHAASALRKLGRALEKLAPLISGHMKRSADVLDADERRRDPIFMQALETLTRAWSRHRKVLLTHEMEDGSIHKYTFSPYFIEPYAVGRTMHVIGYREPPGKIRTFKIERIRTIELLEDAPYEIPASFDPRAQLKDAWGIWYTDHEPVPVRLKFSRKVASRIRETVWHYNQKLPVELENGDVIWEADVADWQEMLSWIRGWGAEVEVLEPEGLRKTLKREAQELAELYQVMETQTKQFLYYAHSRKDKDKSEWQLLKDHLLKTADLAEKFGTDAGISELARTAALLHDLGKYSKAFQARLDGSKRKVDHATAGARTIVELFNKTDMEKWLATMLAYCIAGHHTGLPDYGSSIDVDCDGTLVARLDPAKKILEDFSAYKTEIDSTALILKPRSVKTSNQGFALAFMTRMLYSALVDADFQDTETFIQGKKPRGGHARIEELCEAFNTSMQAFDNPQGEINKKRTETLKACKEKANLEQGFFTLTIPTGGGKTLASMAFALNHAVKHGLKRVIYVIPFTSIIEQNAAVFKEYLGEDNVLEHHSNFDWKKGNKPDTESADDETKDALDKLKLASENWDIPIVVTTNVQFFESLFANKSSRCRKLHNLAKSVIIFDEAQMLPREYLDPCMLAVKELVINYGVSAVFCTATQPALDRRLPKVNFTELAPDPQALFDFYKRVQVTNIGKTPDADLIEKIKEYSQALCIVNTRKHAKGLFDELQGDEGSFHLSTLMCPTHRKEVLEDVRGRLKSGQPCRVISTQVMEAGIDVDFPVGFRALAGLDSIIQAAGRVNREMKLGISDVYVFDPETPFIKKTPIFIKQGAAFAESVMRKFEEQADSKAAIEEYFNAVYNVQSKDAFDVKKILSCFNNGLEFEFKKAAEEFRLIDNNTVAVVIPYNEEAKKLLEQARYHPFPYKFSRQLQMYTVNIYENEFERLQSKGVIETINDTYEALTDMEHYYDKETGLVLPADAGGDAVFFDG